MRIFFAIGFIVLLITLRVLVPREFEALNTTLVMFFRAFMNLAEIINPASMNAASFQAVAPGIPGY